MGGRFKMIDDQGNTRSFSNKSVDEEFHPPRAPSQKATTEQLRFQLAPDLDMDGCFIVPAVGCYGNVATGISNEYGGVTTGRHDQEGADRPEYVYHKDGPWTHCFRSAGGDDDNIENPTGKWFHGALIDWNTGFPNDGVRDTFAKHDLKHATLAIKDESTFQSNIDRARSSRGQSAAFSSSRDEWKWMIVYTTDRCNKWS